MSTTKVRPVAVVPKAAVVVDIGARGGIGHGPIAPQTKRHEHFVDLSVELAAKYGWTGEPTAEIGGFRVEDCQNFIRKTLHEIHVAAVAGTGCPDLAPVAAHFDYLDGETVKRSLDEEDTAELLATLTALYDAETAELKAHKPDVLKAKLEANAAEDKEAKKRAIMQMALGSDA